jgi:NADH:ubiquinone oxidoreductase subunit F (NADH-binding)
VYEASMNVTMRELVYGFAGGVRGGRALKAIIPGGSSTPVILPDQIDAQASFEGLLQAGSMLGSAAIIVMDDTTCMVWAAMNLLQFYRHESCGKCTPCREGTDWLLKLLRRIERGDGSMRDLDLLLDVAKNIEGKTLCPFGDAAVAPVLSTIEHFRGEYEAHIRDHKCPGGVCRALITYSIDANSCNGCMACAKVCPETAITGERKQPHALDAAKCIKCGACISACKQGAIIRK